HRPHDTADACARDHRPFVPEPPAQDSLDAVESARGARRAPAPGVRLARLSYTCGMAATATERKLLIDGEWTETGAWLDIRSPYSGDVVGRVAKGGAADTRRSRARSARRRGSRYRPHGSKRHARCRRTRSPRSRPASSRVR